MNFFIFKEVVLPILEIVFGILSIVFCWVHIKKLIGLIGKGK